MNDAHPSAFEHAQYAVHVTARSSQWGGRRNMAYLNPTLKAVLSGEPPCTVATAAVDVKRSLVAGIDRDNK
jgi:hypothetical protein